MFKFTCILVTFPVAMHFFLLSNDIESHKKKAYIRPIGFIRELEQSQIKIQAMGSFRFLISKTLLCTDYTCMMTHAFLFGRISLPLLHDERLC